mmetsp:Transcript_60414/g.160075  ORF Transcript_60414/g.160075 Transcript_60414/m.160075 type:complete len:206 (+) Transcript_60414:115-732(+)
MTDHQCTPIMHVRPHARRPQRQRIQCALPSMESGRAAVLAQHVQHSDFGGMCRDGTADRRRRRDPATRPQRRQRQPPPRCEGGTTALLRSAQPLSCAQHRRSLALSAASLLRSAPPLSCAQRRRCLANLDLLLLFTFFGIVFSRAGGRFSRAALAAAACNPVAPSSFLARLPPPLSPPLPPGTIRLPSWRGLPRASVFAARASAF